MNPLESSNEVSEDQESSTVSPKHSYVRELLEAEGTDKASVNEEPGLSPQELKAVLESLVFAAEKPVSIQQLAKTTKLKSADIRPLLQELLEDYKGRGVELVEVASGYQFRTAAVCAPFLRTFLAQRPVRLTRAQLESLAIIGYRQPVTRPEIEEIRGVDSGSAIKVLAERDLIKIIGRKDEPGRPLLYGTTPFFLEFFGLKTLRDLPTLREFTELSDESKALFERKLGDVNDAFHLEEPPAEVAIESESMPELSPEVA